MAKELWIYAEQVNGAIASSYYEMLSKVSEIYSYSGDKPVLTAVVLARDQSCARELGKSGCDKVISVCDEKLSDYNPAYYTAALCEAIEAFKPEIV